MGDPSAVGGIVATVGAGLFGECRGGFPLAWQLVRERVRRRVGIRRFTAWLW